MPGRSFSQEALQLHQVKHKQIPPQFQFATLNQDNHIISLHHLVRNEIVLPSQKDDCHQIPADFGNDQLSIRIKDKREEK